MKCLKLFTERKKSRTFPQDTFLICAWVCGLTCDTVVLYGATLNMRASLSTQPPGKSDYSQRTPEQIRPTAASQKCIRKTARLGEKHKAVQVLLGGIARFAKVWNLQRNYWRSSWMIRYVRDNSDIQIHSTGYRDQKEGRVEISRDEGESWQEHFPTAAAPRQWFLFPAQPTLCGERLCPLGATISPSNSFQPGIRAAFPVPFPGISKPGPLQRDRQLVRLGEVSFDVPDSAEAALFAHIKTGKI